MTQKELIEKTIVLKDAIESYKTILETIEYHLNELYLDVHNQTLQLDEPTSNKTSDTKGLRKPDWKSF